MCTYNMRVRSGEKKKKEREIDHRARTHAFPAGHFSRVSFGAVLVLSADYYYNIYIILYECVCDRGSERT